MVVCLDGCVAGWPGAWLSGWLDVLVVVCLIFVVRFNTPAACLHASPRPVAEDFLLNFIPTLSSCLVQELASILLLTSLSRLNSKTTFLRQSLLLPGA